VIFMTAYRQAYSAINQVPPFGRDDKVRERNAGRAGKGKGLIVGSYSPLTTHPPPLFLLLHPFPS
jgi:hypothetical protein